MNRICRIGICLVTMSAATVVSALPDNHEESRSVVHHDGSNNDVSFTDMFDGMERMIRSMRHMFQNESSMFDMHNNMHAKKHGQRRIVWEEFADRYEARISFFGADKSDLDINIDQNDIVIRLDKEERVESNADDGRHNRRTRSMVRKSAYRRFTLPDGIDTTNIQAEFMDGVLTIIAPKKSQWQQNLRKIEVM